MQVEINNKKVHKILRDSDILIKTVGLEMAKKIKIRLNQLSATNNFKEFLENGIGKPHPLSGNLDGMFGISLNKNYRLLIEPLVDSLDDSTLRSCKKINIKGVVDYHDGKCEWLIP